MHCRVCEAQLPPIAAGFWARAPKSEAWVARGPLCLACWTPSTPDQEDSPDAPDPQDAALVERRLRRARIPAGDWGLRLADLDADQDNADAILAVNGWIEEGGGLFLCGPVGGGKTTLCLAAAAERARRGQDVLFWRMTDIEAAWGADFDDPVRQQMLRDLRGPMALVLDDLGVESNTDSLASLLHSAVEGRLRGDVPLIITSNLLPSEAGQRYGTWLASRLAGEMQPLRLMGADRRLRHRHPNHHDF